MDVTHGSLNYEEFAAFIGIDWADKKHDVCLRAANIEKNEFTILCHKPEVLDEWANELRTRFRGQKIAVCLEQAKGPLIYSLMKYDFLVLYPINPVTLARYREAFVTSRAKDDPVDAQFLMEIILKHREQLRPWKPDDTMTRSLGILVEARRKAVGVQTDFGNQLQALLKGYFPQALELIGYDFFVPLTYDFLLKWSRIESLKRATPEEIRQFYIERGSRNEDTIQKRIEFIRTTVPLTEDRAIIETSAITLRMIINQLVQLAQAIKEYEKKIKELFVVHPDSKIFSSFPGAGENLAPRLLALFGTDRSRFDSAQAIQNYTGIAPVLERSGKSTWIHRRWRCPTFLHQTLYEFASRSRFYSPWAAAFYAQQRQRGKGHHTALRSLAFKWLRILYRCWKSGITYDDTLYTQTLQKRGSEVYTRIHQGLLKAPKKTKKMAQTMFCC